MHAINDFKTIYYICFSTLYQETPTCYKRFFNIFRDILHPPNCCSAVSFFSVIFYLLILKLVKWMYLLSIRF